MKGRSGEPIEPTVLFVPAMISEAPDYIVLPRSILVSMPLDWQYALVRLLRELDEYFDWNARDGTYYSVSLRDCNGRVLADPLRNSHPADAEYIERLRWAERVRRAVEWEAVYRPPARGGRRGARAGTGGKGEIGEEEAEEDVQNSEEAG